MEESESGYVGAVDVTEYLGDGFTDVEIKHVSTVNVVACGRRHGRLWLLKGLSPELRGSTAGQRRLMKEFEVHSRLCHRSVVQAVDIENVEGLGACIVMEWVEGDTLATLLREGKLSKAERLRIMRDIVGTVEYLHRNGVVHRDLKPSNIMVRRSGGEVVIVDFGLADTDDYVELKQSAGTDGFISPEQLEAGGVNTSDDVYSLGVMMNELCPQYRKLARRCTGALSTRPADGGELRKLMDNGCKRRKKVVWAAIVSAVVVSAAFGVWRIGVLDETAKRSAMRVDSLMLENQRNADNAAQLSDSLNSVYARMTDAELQLEETKKYSQLYDDSFRNGRKAIDNVFSQFEKTTFTSPDGVDGMIFHKNSTELISKQEQLIQRLYRQALQSDLTENDAVKLKGELNNYYITERDYRWKEWCKKILPNT
ncbi:MAG: serine/threonine protein kinase [Bacteroides sp.]|nr:serine/threonine protein kinase [Bacteroides sp.]